MDQRFAVVAAKLAVDGHQKDFPVEEPRPVAARVVEFSLGDGGARVVYEALAEQVRADYATKVSPFIPGILSGSPSWGPADCAGCDWVLACPAVPQVAGLLGQPSYAESTRSVSASDLDRYAICPSLYFLRTVSHLPGEVGGGSAQSRGIAGSRCTAGWLTRTPASDIRDAPTPTWNSPWGAWRRRSCVCGPALPASARRAGLSARVR